MDNVTNNPFKGEGIVILNETEYKVKLTMNTLRIMQQQFGVKLSDYDRFKQEDPLTATAILAWSAFKAGAISRNESFDLEFDHFADLFFDDMKAQEEVGAIFLAAFPKNVTDVLKQGKG